jgi:hypothetical protein
MLPRKVPNSFLFMAKGSTAFESTLIALIAAFIPAVVSELKVFVFVPGGATRLSTNKPGSFDWSSLEKIA